MKIAVIGAGPSGMTAALQAAWGGAEVTLFERNLIVGRKLLATGSGHCNLTNAGCGRGKIRLRRPGWLNTLFGRFGVSHLLALLEEIGVPFLPHLRRLVLSPVQLGSNRGGCLFHGFAAGKGQAAPLPPR